MKYFIDQEFIEGFHRPFFGKRRHFIDLVSIGIVAEDGREYKALSSEYTYSKANPWVVDNVIRPLHHEHVDVKCQEDHFESTCYMGMHEFHKYCGKTNVQIAQEIIDFINPTYDPIRQEHAVFIKSHNAKMVDDALYAHPEFYGYFSAYDWVLFCSLFGDMSKLPKGFPMYCRDLKQTMDEKAVSLADVLDVSFDRAIDRIKDSKNYPQNTGEHDCLADARFNRDLYAFLKKM